MDGISLNQLYALHGASYDATGTTKASSASNGSAFSQYLSAQLGEDSLFSQAESGSSSSLLVTALLSSLGGEEGDGSLASALGTFCSMLSAGVSGAGLGAAVTSLSSALKDAPESALESLRSALLSGNYSRGVLEQANDALFSSNTSDVNYPFSAGKAVNPLVTSVSSDRSAEQYQKVIEQFSVSSNPRYMVNKKGTGDTYCNIFLWDVTRAMGAEIPHYVDAKTQKARSYPDISGAKELNANGIYDWLATNGASYGWTRVTAEQAQALANEGRPAVTVWKNTSGHGHVQVVCPSKDGTYDAKKGVTIAQAGRNLFSYGYITDVYNKSLGEVVYYAHA